MEEEDVEDEVEEGAAVTGIGTTGSVEVEEREADVEVDEPAGGRPEREPRSVNRFMKKGEKTVKAR